MVENVGGGGPRKLKPCMDLTKDENDMSKRELIDCICEINRTAKPEFLAMFSVDELGDYLEHLMELDLTDVAVCG